MRRTAMMLVWWAVVLMAAESPATSFGPFGPKGEGGSKNGQAFQIGTGGSVYELDSFLAVNGFDLNGSQAGTSAQLSGQSLPAGLTFGFSAALPNPTDAVLTYAFTNLSSGSLTNLRFSVLLDAEIDQELNTFFNEYGAVIGAPGNGPGDVSPDMWQIDEPGFVSGTLLNNLFLGALNNSNSVPPGAPNDVAFGLGFLLGDLAPGQSAAVSVMISSAGHYLGTFALQQFDQSTNSPTTITLSAIVSTLTGTIFKDQNTNGVSDPGEGLAGVKVLLLSGEQTIAQTTTDAGGNYSFNSPPAGNYTVKVDATTLPAGLVNTVDPDGVLDSLTVTTLAPGQLKILNWGYQAPTFSTLTGTIFKDRNTNGVPDLGEGLTNVTVLLLSGEVTSAQTATDADGNYSFDSLPLGTYTVKVDTTTLPPGLTNTVDPDGVLDSLTVATLAPGQLKSLNWGYQSPPETQQFGDVSALTGMGIQWRLKQSTGSLIGTLSLTNLPASGLTLAAPFQLGFPASTNYWLAHPVGTLDNGLPYVNLTAGVVAQAGADGVLSPGERVVVLDGVEIYSRDRSAPPASFFKLWCTQQP